MTCTTHVLGLAWEHHDWQRTFLGAETTISTQTDMWGRHYDADHVICKTRDVCRRCGATRDAVFCGCDKEKADKCAFRHGVPAAH